MLPNIHILGIQGSGKGTQASLLVQDFHFTHLSSGAHFRERAEVRDAFGDMLRSFLEKGELIPTPTLVKAIDQYLASTTIPVGLLADGVIRTVEQYSLLEPIWKKYGYAEPILIYLELSDEQARERMLKRSKEIGRADDLPELIDRRIALFHEKTEPVVEIFKDAGRYLAVDASKSIEEVYAQIKSKLAPLL